MSTSNNLFGAYHPLTTVVHSCPLALKAIIALFLSVFLTATNSWIFSLIALTLVLVVGALAKIPARTWGHALKTLTPLLLILSIYYAVTGKIITGADTVLTLLTMIFAAKILLFTTPMPTIIDGFVKLCTPLKYVGLCPQRIGLALALMIRSIPTIMDSWQELKTAATARGLRIVPWRLLIPLIIATVAYAENTGDALIARGLDYMD
ncbi:energy-coupling factor transporter transmembrane protein EcfT [Canibacter sp. lx-72]|uniref:energy-coupling factor transporter transmembrane component T family protein n=1 Tax=Canibacter zhuwentaonis TaxID=2837491 RepID=UPI001BDD17D2|nr:energy-coupling factor transporter transmembrane protein EcfT [Canibacter zhuwentaonis]MBT1017769.1 energy-coupling factor transporter transmembrane protein EcfT [Canibacter zhuwentaonis]MBT1034924.1 energy-coupling factor transporter transmembrane protein EcfT [Canibacter zhuwentaonis]